MELRASMMVAVLFSALSAGAESPASASFSPAARPGSPLDPGRFLLAAPAPAAPTDAEEPALRLSVEGGFFHMSGYVSAREFERSGTRFRLSDLGLAWGGSVGVAGRLNLGDSNTLEAGFRALFLRGSTSYSRPTEFNATLMPADTTIRSHPEWFEVRIAWLHRLFDLFPGNSLWASVGLDFHYINWQFSATIDPASARHEPGEDFFKQTFPLPILGVRDRWRLAPGLVLDARVSAMRINHLRHWANEGGPIYTSSTVVDAGAFLEWRPLDHLSVELGYAFEYYSLDETGPEDGNHILARRHGPVLSVSLAF